MKENTRSFYESLVRRAVAQVAASVDEALDLAELARHAAISPLHFHRIFRGMVGETPIELHRRLRLERAASLLARTDTKIGSIASEAGYETHESFTRSFRDAYATSPSEYRARAREAERSGSEPPRAELSTTCGLHYANRHEADLALSLNRAEPSLEVVFEYLPERRVAAISHVGPYPTLYLAFERLARVPATSGLWQLPGAALVGLFHDDTESTPNDELRSDAGIIVPEDAVIPAPLIELRLPGGRYARTTHFGAHERLSDAWPRFMGQWLPYSGERIAPGPMYEVFRNLRRSTPVDQLRTDLYLPVL